MSDTTTLGRCPSCERDGAVGAPCQEPICRRHGYHCIPADVLAALDPKLAADARALIGTVVAGRYLVAGVLGKGAFGRVLLALQAPLWRPAALKQMEFAESLKDEADRFRDQFRREAEALAALAHDNVVRLIDYIDDDGQGNPVLVMEYIAGKRTLRSEVRARARAGLELSGEEVHRWIRQVLAGLAAAHGHARCIVHRDLKPDNIMLAEVPGVGLSAKIVDFGLAKYASDSTRTKGALGTLRYMAPEQLRAREIGPATDLYAVGVIALELVTGRQLFALGSDEAIVDAKRDPTYDPLTPLADLDLPGAVREFAARALAFDPKQRVATATAMDCAFDAMMHEIGGLPRATGAFDPALLLDPSERAELDRLRREVSASQARQAAVEVELALARRAAEVASAEVVALRAAVAEPRPSTAASRSPEPPAPIAPLHGRMAAPPPPSELMWVQVWAACVVVVVCAGLVLAGR